MIIFWLSRGCGCGGGVAAGPGQLRAAAVVTLRAGLYNASESGDSFSGEKTAKLAT